MSREYNHIQQYAKQIYKLRKQGLNLNEIGKQLGFTHKQMRNFVYRENRNQRKLTEGIVIKSISDLANKDKDDSYQSIASKTSALCVKHLITDVLFNQ